MSLSNEVSIQAAAISPEKETSANIRKVGPLAKMSKFAQIATAKPDD